MKLPDETIKLFEEFCDCYEYRFYQDYSGRGAFGAKCIGIICESPGRVCFELAEFFFEYLEGEELSNALEAVQGVRQDSMGLDVIIYFPSIQWIEEDESENEE